MSENYRLKYGNKIISRDEMREHCKAKFPVDKDGKPIYFTEQNHKKECDVNLILKKYDKTGLVTHIQQFEAEFGDYTGLDFRNMLDTVRHAQADFDQLPSEIKKRFNHDPGELLAFIDDDNNYEEAIKLGIISQEGLTRHLKRKEAAKPPDEK